MKFDEPIEGIVIGTLEDHDSMKQLDYSFDKEKNILIFKLPNGWYEGDDKTFILFQNDLNTKILIECEISRENTLYSENFHSFFLRNVGESISIFWSLRFKGWWIRTTGCHLLSHEEYNAILENKWKEY